MAPDDLLVELQSSWPSDDSLREWRQLIDAAGTDRRFPDPRWQRAVCDGLGHPPYLLSARRSGRLVGILPLAFVKSLLFGRFLVSLPYANSGGVVSVDAEATAALVDRAVELATSLDVRYLELRHERAVEHPELPEKVSTKVHMRLPLPRSADELWRSFDPKVRNQVRKGEKSQFQVVWGRHELLGEFHRVFSHNMRDLGTPTYGQRLFRCCLESFGDDAEFCVVRDGSLPVAAAFLVHSRGETSVESASTLRAYNPTNVNMWMYWQLLQRAVERGQEEFGFGRSSLDSNTYRFKKQWGAQPYPAEWQYHVRRGDVAAMRRESGKYDRVVGIWRRLPLGLTRILGPVIVRGIP